MSTSPSAPTPSARRLRVFLCHGSGDKPAVRDLYGRLQADGYAPWLDEKDLLPGQVWQEEIPAAVRAADVVVVCLSRTSVNKEGYLQREIREALFAAEEKPEGTIFLIPLRLEEVGVPRRLSQWQWANLFEEDGYQRLVSALSLRAGALGVTIATLSSPVPPPPRKPEKEVALPRPDTTPAGTVRMNPKDGLKYIWIPSGTFQMGCSAGDNECNSAEEPAHSISIAKGFWLGQTAVTQGAYQRVMGSNPSHFHGEQLPVERVDWTQARAYCEAVGGRLPTEAEWEYAARAGNPAARYGGDLDAIAWYDKNSGNKTHEVGLKQPNPWGLYDMLGNVWEWVEDWYDENYYKNSPAVDPPGPRSGQYRVVRGGSWNLGSRILRSSVRFRSVPNGRVSYFGFRCAGEVFP